MSASPSRLIRQILINAEVCILPGIREVRDDPWVQCFVNTAPNDINNCVLVRDAQGIGWGHDQRTGKRLQHQAVMLTMRHELESEGERVSYAVADALEDAVNAGPMDLVVDDFTYYVQSVYLTSDVISLGEEVGKRRFLWSLSARVAMQARERTPVE